MAPVRFRPPFCPNVDCRFHRDAPDGFCTRHGAFKPQCRPTPVPRFRCRGCRRTFSRQTFRFDYRCRKPHLYAELFRHLVSGGSMRQFHRLNRCARRTVDRALVRIGHHAGLYHANARSLLELRPNTSHFLFDELETHEHHRILMPVTAGTLLQQGTSFLFGAECGTLRSRASKSEASKARRREFEKRCGKRKNQSRAVVERLLKPLAEVAKRKGAPLLCFTTDEKKLYPHVLRAEFAGVRFVHQTVSSKEKRDGANPLAPINHLDTMSRHHNARLQRESIAASKKLDRLELQMHVFVLWWNYWRHRRNCDRRPPAYYAGVLSRRAQFSELLGWRQDFGPGRLPLIAD